MAYSQLSYDPWETTPVERKARFVGREALLQRILADIAAQPELKTIQHYLLLGPRGIGKTTLLLTLRERIREHASLSARWFCVQFREEEYFVRTLRDLLELTLSALAEDEELPEAAEAARRVREEPREERSLAAAVDGLRALASRHGKRILLLVDNFDRVFPATSTGPGKKHSPENEFRRFRKLLSTESFLMVIGASVRLFQEIATYDRAFFNFFSPIEVPDLSEDEICQLLRRCAEAEGNASFLAQFDTVRDKVRAITFMTGGNPRLVLMLYDVLRHREMTPVVQALRETVGGLTPLLKHVLDDMPRQQSKTLDALVRLRGADSPKGIAEMARLPLNVVTAQLGRLKEGRFVEVEGEGKGKPATYRISDPMFQTWYQMRYLRPAGRRVELFVEFIRAWFSVEERRQFLNERWGILGSCGKRAGAFQEVGLTIQYYAAALEDEGERRAHFERLADVYVEAGNERDAAMLLAESLEAPGLTGRYYESEGYRLLGERRWEKGDAGKAIAAFRKALKKEPENAQAALGLGFCLGSAGEHALAATEFGCVIEMRGASVEQVALALFNRGVARGTLGNSQGEIADYTEVVALPDAPTDWVARALVNRGVTKGSIGDNQGAIADYTAVVDLPSALAEQVAMALVNRGFAKGVLGDRQAEIVDYTSVVDLPDVPAECGGQALVNRGLVKRSLGDSEGAIADYTAVVELPGAPAEQVAKALFNRGLTKVALGDSRGAIADFTAAVQLPGALPEQVAMALVNRGVTKRSIGDTQGGIADYTAVVELPGASPEHVARALVNRGGAFGNAGETAKALQDFQLAIDLPGASLEQRSLALSGSGVALTALGKIAEAVVRFEQALELRASAVSVYAAFNGLLAAHLASNRVDEAGRWMSRLHEYETLDAPLDQRLEVRIDAVLTAGRESGVATAEFLLDAALRGGPEDIRARLEFLAPAIQYAKTGDEQTLARLPEREIEAAKKIAASLMEKAVPTLKPESRR